MKCDNCDSSVESLIEREAVAFKKNQAKLEKGLIKICETCRNCFDRRNEFSQKILNSSNNKRLIVAGPGTGKTHTFKSALEKKSNGVAAVFTLINNLATDLQGELSQFGEDVKINTFHGFCKSLLHSSVPPSGINHNFYYYPKLPTLIEQDSSFFDLNFNSKQIQQSFADIDEQNGVIKFYLDSSAYYNSVSHNDSVYRVYKYYLENKNSIPSYALVIADEYQDFNSLEAGFIDLLSSKNNILIAGDDDQSLYLFRSASNKFIRKLHKDENFEHFELPYCSRCTPAIVESTNHLIKTAKNAGHLQERIEKEFSCYWPDKHEEDKLYPVIYHAECSKLNTALEYIYQRILALFKEEEQILKSSKDIQFLIIGPESGFHIKKIKEYLETRLDLNQFKIQTPSKDVQEISIEEGYKIIKDGRNKNLGWRIVLYCEPVKDLKEIIKKALTEKVDLETLLPKDYTKKHLSIIESSTKEEAVAVEEPEENKIIIKLTNFYGSKGLSALHTFVIGVSDYTFPVDPKNITDDEICKFLVALTRAKRSCVLVTHSSFDGKNKRLVSYKSSFIQMLPTNRLEKKIYKMSENKLVIQSSQ